MGEADKVTLSSYILDLQPPLTNFWQGREQELAEISGWLADPAMRFVGIRATGGYGKSALAAKLCETLTGFEQILWVSFTQAHSFGVWAREVLRLLGAGDLEASLSDRQVITFGVNYLSQHRYLVVMDNAETLLQPQGGWQDAAYEQFLLHWLEMGRQTVLLMTSRENPLLAAEHSEWKTLEGLSVGAGVALLEERGIRGAGADLEAFVRLADGHPLLLNLTVGWLKNPRQNAAAEVSYALKQDDLYRFGQIVGLHRGNKEASVGTVLAESVARLEGRWQHLWQDVSVYDRAFGLEAAQAMQPEATLADLYGLVDRSLIQELTGQQFELLPLIQRFAQQQAGDQAAAHEKAVAYYSRCCLPLEVDTPAVALVAYLGLFYHACELGRYAAAWNRMQQRTVADEERGRYSSCDMFLKFQGSGSDRLKLWELYERLRQRWQPDSRDEQTLFADTLKAIGEVLQFLDRRSEALEHYQSAIEIYRQVGARLGEANTLQAIGDVLQFLARRSEALEHYQSAIEIYRQVGDRLGEANTLKAIGEVLQFLDRRSEALEHYQSAIEIYRQVGDRLGEANTLKAIGEVLQFLDRRSEALEHYQSAIEIYRQVGARLGEANSLKAIGDVLQFLARRSEALEHYQSAIEIYRQVGARLGEANTLQAIGDVLQFLARRSEALEHYQSAIEIYRQVGDRLGEANTLLGLGSLQDDSEQAMVNFLAAQAIFEQIGDKYSQGRNLLMFIINAQWQQGDRAGVLRSLDTAAAIGDEIGFEPFRQVADQIRAELPPEPEA